MRHFQLTVLTALAAVALACGGASVPTSPGGPAGTPGGPTTSPVGSIAVPTLPPVDVPSGLPSVPAGADACALITAAEMQSVFGAPATLETDEAGACTITQTGELLPIVMRYGQDETIEAAKMIVDNGEDLTVGGNRAFYGELMGGILYIEKNGRTLVLQSPLNTEVKDAMIRIGEIAITRF